MTKEGQLSLEGILYDNKSPLDLSGKKAKLSLKKKFEIKIIET